MDTSLMDVPYTRQEIERRMNLLGVAISNGKVIFTEDCPGSINSLSKVMRMDNGRIDLLTIDESVRLQANMLDDMDIFNSLEDNM